MEKTRMEEIAYWMVFEEMFSQMRKQGFDLGDIHDTASKLKEDERITFLFLFEIFWHVMKSLGKEDLIGHVTIPNDKKGRIAYKALENMIMGRNTSVIFFKDKKSSIRELENKYSHIIKEDKCTAEEIYEVINFIQEKKLQEMMHSKQVQKWFE